MSRGKGVAVSHVHDWSGWQKSGHSDGEARMCSSCKATESRDWTYVPDDQIDELVRTLRNKGEVVNERHG